MAITTSNDELLAMVAGISSEDRNSMDRLFTAMYSSLYRFAVRMVGENEAEDLVNETMLEVWMHSGSFKGDSKVSTWIFGILRMLCLKRYQKQSAKKRDKKELAAHEEELADELAAGMATEADTLATAEEIEQYLQYLSDEHRSVILLVVQGYTYKEIGKIEQCPENTAKTRVFHARKNLKVLIKLSELTTAGERI